jgi:GNAT superfamily N-acetyltransferase
VVIGERKPDALEEDNHTPVSPQFRPLEELEAEAWGTGYINMMSVAEAWQGQGIGTALLLDAERWRGPRGMSLIVSNENTKARRFYERNGYAEATRRRKVKETWQTPGTEWILLRKP